MRLTAGSRVGPYEVLALLGTGGMAEVYRARDTRLGRDVALKVVADVLAGDVEFLARIKREAKLAGSINHPNVIAVYDVGQHGDSPYFVTELLWGETLRERLAKGALPLSVALDWAVQMAQGLAAAHDRDVIHRDLKPANVFITKDGHVKLLDFGIAKLGGTRRAANSPGRDALLDETTSRLAPVAGTAVVLGTPAYMSPEQVSGGPVDARTDFFSLGALLYEMLSGRQAFPVTSAGENGYAILCSEPEPLPATVPQTVAQVVDRCLEKDRAKRFQSARDLAFHLEALRANAGSRAPTSKWVPPVRSRRWWMLPILGALALAAASGATYLVMRARELPMPTVERITFRRGAIWGARFAPDGRVVYSAVWGGASEELFSYSPGAPDSQSLNLSGARLLGVSGQGELAVALNPLGFGVEGAGGTLALLPAVGGAPRKVADGIIAASWSQTGELAVVRWGEGGRRRLEYPLGTPLFESSGLIGFPRVSPKGDMVAFWSQPNGAEKNELLLVDKNRGVRHLVEGQLTGLAWSPNGQEVWFSEDAAIWASPLTGGGRRLVYQGVSDMWLEDISRDGKVLVNVVDARSEILVLQPEHPSQAPLPWSSSNVNDLVAISGDGRQLLVNAYPGRGRPWADTYIRPTDGSASIKLGLGRALAFSPDEKQVLVTSPDSDLETGPTTALNDASLLWLVPVGMGVPKRLPVKGLNFGTAQWLRDGKRLVVLAQRTGETRWRMFFVSPEDGTSTLTELPLGAIVSPDERFAASWGPEGTPALYPLNGGPFTPLSGLGKDLAPIQWTSDGQLWLSHVPPTSPAFPMHLLLYDVPSGRVVAERTIAPGDVTGVATVENIRLTPDSRTIAIQYYRALGDLYLLSGLAAPRP